MLTESELKQIQERSQRMVCDECKTFIPKLIDELNHFKSLCKLYKGDVLELSREYKNLQSQYLE